jgi:type II restriction enzyme
MIAKRRLLIDRWKKDPGGAYQTWFLWSERLKNFRSIRRGLEKVVEEIENDKFGSLFKGSSLEVVLHSITEQKQLFKGADHAFQWKPKLRIPDIYENKENQKAFARFLKSCLDCCDGGDVIRTIHELDGHKIKGLGPAAANLLYFLHPTIVPPFNTAIVNGFNALTGSKVKLGKWTEYLAMREGVLRLVSDHGNELSNDLGAVSALLYDIGIGRYAPPPAPADESTEDAWKADLERTRAESAAAKKGRDEALAADVSHTNVQGWLRDLGLALGYDVWIAANDRSRTYVNGALGDGCLEKLPFDRKADADSIRLIDVLWLAKGTDKIVAAFEVEHSTSIYSGILRLYDLAFSGLGKELKGLYLVAPDEREEEVRKQLIRPAFQRINDLKVRFLPYAEFERHRTMMAKFGEGLKAIEAIAKHLVS